MSPQAQKSPNGQHNDALRRNSDVVKPRGVEIIVGHWQNISKSLENEGVDPRQDGSGKQKSHRRESLLDSRKHREGCQHRKGVIPKLDSYYVQQCRGSLLFLLIKGRRGVPVVGKCDGCRE